MSGSIAAQQATDSGGVRIRRYARDAVAPARWSLDETPALVIGGASGEGMAELASVVGAVRLADGRVAIANGATSEVRVFTAAGAFVRTIGRKGQGPGEFDRLVRIARKGSGFLAFDGSQRVQEFDSAGKLLRVVPRSRFGDYVAPAAQGILSDGAVVVTGLVPPDESAGERFNVMLALGLQSGTDMPARVIAHLPAYEVTRKAGAVGIPGMRGFSAVFLGAVARVAVTGTRVCTTYSALWEVTCYGVLGPLWSTRRDIAREPLTEADRSAFREAFLRMNPSAPRDRMEAIAATFDFARFRPVIGQILTAGEDLWVEGGEAVIAEQLWMGRAGKPVPTTATTWSVLGPDGRWRADVTLPRGLFLLDAGADAVVGVERDEDDVERVVVYRLRRPR